MTAGLCRDFDVLNLTGRQGDKASVFSQSIDMKHDGFTNFSLDLPDAGTCGDASRQVRDISRVI